MLISAFNAQKESSINVIGIEWGDLASNILYLPCAIDSQNVGILTGEKIAKEMLIDNLHQDPKLIEAVGHSLGAHVVGHLGRSIFNSIGQKIKRVTGLFSRKKLKKRLMPSNFFLF